MYVYLQCDCERCSGGGCACRKFLILSILQGLDFLKAQLASSEGQAASMWLSQSSNPLTFKRSIQGPVDMDDHKASSYVWCNTDHCRVAVVSFEVRYMCINGPCHMLAELVQDDMRHTSYHAVWICWPRSYTCLHWSVQLQP